MKRLGILVLAALFFGAIPGSVFAAARDLVGKSAPGFAGVQVSGEPLSLSAYLGKVPVILTFWSIYCKSCTEEMTSLQRLYAKYGAGQVAVIAVNEDGDIGLPRVRLFLERFMAESGRLTFPTFFDEKGDVFRKYAVVHLPTLVYIDKGGVVREVIEGFERGSELAVSLAIEKLIEAVSPLPLKEVAAEAVYDLDAAVPVCGVYRDGRWYRPLDLDESGRPEAVARARAQGEEHLRREALRLALSRLGMALLAEDRRPECFASYGLEIRTPAPRPDPLDLLLESLNLPRVMEVVSQETVEREREVRLYRRIKVGLPAFKEQLEAEGYSAAKSAIRVRFVLATYSEERAFVEAVHTQFPYLASIRSMPSSKGGSEYLIECHATPERAIESLRGLDVGPRRLSIELLPGNVAEVAVWR